MSNNNGERDMELGLGKNEVRLTSHDPRWKLEYEKIKNEILRYTAIEPDNIKHIGSTAISGIKAKPIIDVLIGVNDLEKSANEYKEGLLNVGIYRLRVQRENEIVFAKDKNEEIRTHYFHMVKYKGELWNDLVFFSAYLNQNKEYRTEYENLKKSLADENCEGIDDYTLRKEEFVKRIVDFRN